MKELISSFSLQIVILAILYLTVLVFVALDLWSGIRKAKCRGEFRSSRGFRRTVEKVCKYYNMLIVVSVIDCSLILAAWEFNFQINSNLPMIPICTFIAAIFIGFIELKSIYEKNEEKEKAKMLEAAELLAKIIKDGEAKDIADNIISIIKKSKGNND